MEFCIAWRYHGNSILRGQDPCLAYDLYGIAFRVMDEVEGLGDEVEGMLPWLLRPLLYIQTTPDTGQ